MEKGVLPAALALIGAIVLIGLSGRDGRSLRASQPRPFLEQIATGVSNDTYEYHFLAAGDRDGDRLVFDTGRSFSLQRDRGRLEESERRAQEAGKADPRAVDDQRKREAKAALGPSELALETSLESARSHLKGLKAGAELADPTGLKSLRSSLDSSIQAALREQAAIRGKAGRIEGLTATEEYLRAQSELSKLKNLHGDWQARSSRTGYWRSTDEVRKDLDAYEKQLDATIDRAREFGTSRLDVSATRG
jgi:hypothetical protein